MNSRMISTADLGDVLYWFTDQKWPMPPIEGAAPDFGILTEDSISPISACFVYQTGRSIAFVDWIGLNPERKDFHSEAMKHMFESLKENCVKVGIKALCHYSKTQGLKEYGFKVEDGFKRSLWSLK